jgi:electron transfer flavoprotein alpha subunit
MNDTVNLALICGKEYGRLDVLTIVDKLRKLSVSVSGIVFVICNGRQEEAKLSEIANYGAHKVIVCNEEKEPSSYIEFCETFIIENQIGLITFLDSAAGKELAAILATSLGGGLTADCIDIAYNGNGQFIFSRVALNDSVIAQIVCINTRFQMCTIKENTLKKDGGFQYERGEIEAYSKIATKNKIEQNVKVLSRTPYERKSNAQIQKAKKIFGFGRGIKSLDNLEKLKRLAKKYSAEVGGTRACVEENWLDEEHQIGQSGISISPQIYVAFGISGASQHIVGTQNAKIIVSVNNDEAAPIFQYSDYVLIEDTSVIIDELIHILETNNLT